MRQTHLHAQARWRLRSIVKISRLRSHRSVARAASSLDSEYFGAYRSEAVSVDRFGLQFGLIVREPENEQDVFAVELLPGNYMAFFEPWDSGDYDT